MAKTRKFNAISHINFGAQRKQNPVFIKTKDDPEKAAACSTGACPVGDEPEIPQNLDDYYSQVVTIVDRIGTAKSLSKLDQDDLRLAYTNGIPAEEFAVGLVKANESVM